MPTLSATQAWKATSRNDMTIPFNLQVVGGNQFGRYPRISKAETLNMIVSDKGLVPLAGYETVSVIANAKSKPRALYNADKYEHMIAVIDDGVYEIDKTLSAARIGTLNTAVGVVFISDNNGSQIAITDGIHIYIFDYSLNQFIVVTPSFAPGMITFQDTYFICVDKNSNQWFLSGNNDGTQWTPTAQTTGELETKGTLCTGAQAINRQLFIFGKTVCEPWYDQGLSLFPYVRNTSTAIDYGCINPKTIAVNGGKDEQAIVCWLGSNEKSGVVIMAMINLQPVQISDDGVNYILGHLKNPQDSVGFMYRLDGHLYYHITFITDNITYIYDFNTKQYFTLTDEYRNHFIAQSIVFFNNSYYFLSFNNGNLYKLDSEIYTYDGAEIPYIRILESINLDTNANFVLANMTLRAEQGNIPYVQGQYQQSGQYIDLCFSKDGGQSFGRKTRKFLFPPGKTKSTIQWTNCGFGNDIVPQFRFIAKGRFVITNGTGAAYL